MGYYFPEAKTKSELNPEQMERYEALRAKDAQIPAALQSRVDAIRKRVGPITSGEIIAAREELVQDAIVCWVLSGEDPNIEWVERYTEDKEPTAEEIEQSRIWWENFFREEKERREREKAEREQQFDAWEKEHSPVRYFFRTLFARLRKS